MDASHTVSVQISSRNYSPRDLMYSCSNTDATQYVRADVPLDSYDLWMSDHTHQKNIKPLHYVRVDAFSELFYNEMIYYIWHRNIHACHYVYVDGKVD